MALRIVPIENTFATNNLQVGKCNRIWSYVQLTVRSVTTERGVQKSFYQLLSRQIHLVNKR